MNKTKFIATLFISLTAIFTSQAETAKYVFYFIGDGMGMGHVNTTETYNRDVLKSDKPILMMTFPVASQVRTYSFNNPITDSAAAGTALSTGNKTNNSMVGMDPDTTDVYSIATDFMKLGRPVGVVSSVAGDDATPAAFYAHAPKRSMKREISDMAITSGLTFLGAPAFRGGIGDDEASKSWATRMSKEGGYAVVYDYSGYQAVKNRAGKVLMLASKPQGDQAGYTIDSIAGTISIQQLTEACLDRMLQEGGLEKGFFMMAEGGNIDWAAHANDGAAVIKEILNFQKAIDIAYQFYLQHPDETLIVITADHDTGGMALGRRDASKGWNLSKIDFQKISKDRFQDWCKANADSEGVISWDTMLQFLKQNLGLDLIHASNAEIAEIKQCYEDTYVNRTGKDEKTLYKNFDAFTTKVYDVVNRHYGIGFTTNSHTANPVPLYAIGAGADLFKGMNNNTEVPKNILKAAGIK